MDTKRTEESKEEGEESTGGKKSFLKSILT